MHETGRCTLGDDSELGNSAGYQVGDEVGNSVENLVAKALRSMTSHGSSHLQASNKQAINKYHVGYYLVALSWILRQ